MVAITLTCDKSQHAGNALDDYPAPTTRTEAEQDLRYGQMAVVIHQGEDWPSGRLCRNCKARWPCRLQRWGFAVLVTAGWTKDDVKRLLARARAGEVPWA